MSKLRTFEVNISENLLDQASELGLDVSEVLTAALQERINASCIQSTPKLPVYVEKPLTDLERAQAANKLRVASRVYANVPLGME